ncbi:hypothetical protein GXM_00583 [Nostoc sphaeroides CCNUC1]|uniref:Uncharacterized protein n=1 Tax=Nostoc sphaeroides CCNUC1 TaxID=2653204 RepID=A0A5P8VRZ2_9NOSO|nr:hypothetical protein GXM_00583 [Nostoc sphaeroides CCNUC1]
MNFLGLLNANAQFNQPHTENLNDQRSNTHSDFSPKIKKAIIVRAATFSRY